MLRVLNQKLKKFCFGLRWPIRRRSKTKIKITIKQLGKSNSQVESDKEAANANGSALIHPTNGHDELGRSKSGRTIRVATFNAALFSMAPALPKKIDRSASFDFENDDYYSDNLRAKSTNDRPKSILKQSPLHPSKEADTLLKKQAFAKSKLRVSINLPDNEISLKKSGQLSFLGCDSYSERFLGSNICWGKAPIRSTVSMPRIDGQSYRSTRSVVEVLRELNADVLALQDVKAEEEKGMKPLSDLAAALGMNYVFAESWAPEYGNAIMSKWPIKSWNIQKIFDDSDFRNVLKATIDVPRVGEFNFYCTHLDHLDENWRMKQMNAIIQSSDKPHILAGGLNSLDETDYSPERWTDIVKYYEEMGKPTPKVEVMKHLKSKEYTDAKDFAGECESVVMIAKGQSVQGTCKYGTRVDYILSSSDSPYKFVPGSYSVFSSKGTSDHHIVKVDMVKVDTGSQQYVNKKRRQAKHKVVRITHSNPNKGVWKIDT
ncbi:PREDICTED: uncharacterized protein LOC109209527 [Nicotiana attenuata]|uniref:Endonuclease/exonuclease/phosphatase domain-containing protein n=1 Tax=Nicotiana attenuata TaxID=49451 RepID=A0A1J6J0D3_NICAT|nr:PREDICTED: uncharacterized protein LOC109209527 [Nicotiana attenuata]OIT06224.1 hypothetical protein A4A49_01632 [Nicotiana attenuata]